MVFEKVLEIFKKGFEWIEMIYLVKVYMFGIWKIWICLLERKFSKFKNGYFFKDENVG